MAQIAAQVGGFFTVFVAVLRIGICAGRRIGGSKNNLVHGRFSAFVHMQYQQVS